MGWDGVRDDRLRELRPPAATEVASGGQWWTTELPDVDVAPTVTAVGWSSILTGVGPELHEVHGNEDTYHLLHRYPDMLTRAFCARPDLETYAATSALIFGTNFGPGPILGPGVRTMTWFDRRQYAGGFADTDQLVTADAEQRLRWADPDLTFVYLGETDAVAHTHGVGDEYTRAIQRQDERLGRMLAAIKSRETFAVEDWLVMLTTDHGHRDEGGHGGASWQERQSFVIAGLLEPRPATWASQARNIDIAPTAWAHLAVVPSARWLCQGMALLGPPSVS